jgi:chromosome partitioning protein
MMIVIFSGQKGGTGKTTLATNVAGMLAAEGRRVLLIDADPQGSARDWWEARPPRVAAVRFMVVPGTPAEIREACTSPEHAAADITLVDTGGRISPGVREAVRLSDFLVVPVLPSLPDIRSTEDFYDRVLGDVARQRPLRGAVVLNAVQRGVTLCDEAEAYLREQTELPVMGAVLHQYVAFRRAIGLGQTVCELEPAGRAAADMRIFLASLKEEIEP